LPVPGLVRPCDITLIQTVEQLEMWQNASVK